MALTKTKVQEAKSQKGKDVFVWDSEVKGFGLRVTPGGTKSFVLKYGLGESGRSKRMTLGSFGDLTVEEARELARERKKEARNGEDPAAKVAQKKARPTVKEFSKVYMEEHAILKKRESTAVKDQQMFNRVINPSFLGRKRVDLVTKADVVKLHLQRRETPYDANHMVRLLSKMFEVARTNLSLKAFENPAKRIEMFDEPMRERALDDEELARLDKVLKDSVKLRKDGTREENPYAIAAIRLLILTGARRSEILDAKWENVIWDSETPAFLRIPLPKEATRKTKRKEKTIPLAPAAARLIKSLPRVEENDHIIVGRKAGTSFVGLSKVWERIRVKAKLVNVPGQTDPRIHDLRHTWASQALQGGEVTIDDIRPIMGHSSAQTTLRYAHYADQEKAKTANAVAKKIGEAMSRGGKRRGRGGQR